MEKCSASAREWRTPNSLAFDVSAEGVLTVMTSGEANRDGHHFNEGVVSAAARQKTKFLRSFWCDRTTWAMLDDVFNGHDLTAAWR
jgi:hypothetical protein